MGRILAVAVAKENWPTRDALNAALSRQQFDIQLQGDGAGDEPWGSPGNFGTACLTGWGRGALVAEFFELCDEIAAGEGRKALVDAAYLKAVGIDTAAFGAGDRLLELSFHLDSRFRVNAAEWRAGAMIAATLIREFGGYGIIDDTQDGGTFAFADRLIAG